MEGNVTVLLSNAIEYVKDGIRDYKAIQSDNSLPKAFHELGPGLQFLATRNKDLHVAQSKLAEAPPGTTKLLQSYNSKARSFADIFEAVAKASEPQKVKVYEEAVSLKSHGQAVEVVVMGMINDAYALAKEFKIENQEMRDQVKGLCKAIAMIEPSLPKESSGNTYHNSGSGNQFNAPNGTVNQSSGNGPQFPGATFSAPLHFGSSSDP